MLFSRGEIFGKNRAKMEYKFKLPARQLQVGSLN